MARAIGLSIIKNDSSHQAIRVRQHIVCGSGILRKMRD